MKKYYNTLDKTKKKEIQELYKKRYAKSDLETRFFRLRIYAGVALLFAIFVLIYALIYEENKTASIILAITLTVLALVYLIGIFIIKRNVLNKLALEKGKHQ